MKKSITLFGVCLSAMAMMILSTSIVSGQSVGDTIKIGKGGVNIHAKDGSSVKVSGNEVINKSKSASGVSAHSGTMTFSKDTTISGREINADSDGLILKGSANYTVVDCRINAGQNAIVVSDHATVTLKNCILQGEKAAIVIKNNGVVKASKNVINGKIQKLDGADYIDNGGNVHNNL